MVGYGGRLVCRRCCQQDPGRPCPVERLGVRSAGRSVSGAQTSILDESPDRVRQSRKVTFLGEDTGDSVAYRFLDSFLFVAWALTLQLVWRAGVYEQLSRLLPKRWRPDWDEVTATD